MASKTGAKLWRYIPGNTVFYDEEDGQKRLNLIRERFDKMRNYWSPIFEQARKEDAFIAGHQWDDIIRKERERTGRPMFTFNLLPAICRQIINAARMDRPQLRVKPVESDKHQTPDVANVQGTKDYSLADVYMGIFRNIEHTSRADQAYDTALQHAVWHSFGFFMLNTQESRHDPFVQDLVVQRVKDSFSIIVDPSAQMADFSDMADAFVFQRVSKDTFERLYPDAITGSFNLSVEAGLFGDWFDRDSLQIATYYWIEYEDDEVVKMNDGRIHYFSEVEDVLDDWKRQGRYIARGEDDEPMRKKVKRPVVKWQRFTALEFLTDETETVFERIPIFPVLGDEIVVDGRTQYMSAIRDAIDPQKSYNFHRTAAIETLALQPKAPFVGTVEQLQGWEKEWSEANKSTKPYLKYNHVEGAPPPARAAPPQPAFAELNQALQDAQDIQAVIGIHEATLGAESNEKSGKAVLARQKQGRIGTYQFPANLGRAIEACGRCAIEAIPKIYDTERVVRVRMPDDTEDFVTINQMVKDEKSGRVVLTHDLAYGKYDVVIDTGPSYATQREESIEAMLELLSVLPPESLVAVTHLIVENMAFPGADKVAAILRKLIPEHLKSEQERAADLPKGVVFNDEGQPIHEETGEPYEPPLTPDMQLLAQQQRIDQAKVDAEVADAEGDKALAEAKVVEARAKIAKAQAEVAALSAPQGSEGPDVAGVATELRQLFNNMLEEHKDNPDAHRDAVDSQVSEVLADLIPALRKLVDKQVEEAKAESQAARAEAQKGVEDVMKKIEKIAEQVAKKEVKA